MDDGDNPAVGDNQVLTHEPVAYGDWRDVYAERWTWDRVVRCSHTRANCLSACAWDVYVKDGIVWREEQAQVYDEGGRGGAPDFSPRGCQKGACYSGLMTSAQRLRYPLERVGERGGGRWRRISWEAAFDRIADAIIAAAMENGPETVVHIPGPNFDQGPSSAAEFRFSRAVGASVVDTFAGIGDMPLGCIQTWGMFLSGGTSDDWFNSDYIVIWSGNPAYTRIPDMHFITEARYHGTRVVVIGPDYNATAIHADLWLNPKVESDPALALAMAQVITSEDLIDDAYVREQTDLPFLLRTDNGRFLRESDVQPGGRDDAFYLWDENTGAPVLAPGTQGMKTPSLALDGIRPALKGRQPVQLANGARIDVEPVYEVLRRELNGSHTPELAERTTGVAAEVIRRVAREMATVGAAMIYASVGACKHYHSDLMHRSMALLMALTGNQGRPGGGLRVGSWWGLTGFDELSQMEEVPWWQRLLLRVKGRFPVRDLETYLTEHTLAATFTPALPWLYVHAGYAQAMGNPAYNDGANPLAIDDAMKIALEQNWIPIYPSPGKDPKVFMVTACNPLRRWPAPQIALEHLWPKFELVVNINTHMSTTGMYSDLVLPGAGFYEKEGIKYVWGFIPYVVLDDKAVEPLGESRNEWWIFGSLARRIQERARLRGVGKTKDVFGKDFDLKKIFDVWSDEGTFDPSDQRPAMDYIFERSEICEGTTWDEAIKRGLIPVKRNGLYSSLNNMCSDVDFERPLYPHVWQVEEKESWPTLTGRQQFYLDHDWYLAAGEALPVHKGPPAAGGPYPLRLTGGHTRWSIHAIWRSDELMQQLQRGEPVLYMNPDDARARRISDNDRARVFNDVGEFECLVKPAPSVQPGQAIIYHAWESFQFAGYKGQQEPIPSPWKALHLVGDYGQLHYRGLYGGPNFGPRGTTVEIEPA
jgi:DMSO reductase family type II enzyme molybdopterin subunit